MKLPLLVLVGPTAVGKTAVSVAVARRLGAEIISGDSMQVYRGLNIGTAKVSAAEMQGVPHHLIDIKEPHEEFSVAEFRSRVDALIPEIIGRNRLPMLVGGTGLYVRSVLTAYSFTEQEADHALRRRLAAEEEEHGPGHLHQHLMRVDPEAAGRLHPNDLRRIIWALEVFQGTGVPISASQTAAAAPPRYDDLFLGLTMNRELLYQRIEGRVDEMLRLGLEAEVNDLLARFGPRLLPLQAIGYKEMVQYLRGLLTAREARELLVRNTRRFAKRQFTWFKRDDRIQWIDASVRPTASVVEEITSRVEGKRRNSVEAGYLWSRLGNGESGGQFGV